MTSLFGMLCALAAAAAPLPVVLVPALCVHTQACQKESGHCCPRDAMYDEAHREVAGAVLAHAANVVRNLRGPGATDARTLVLANGLSAASTLLARRAARGTAACVAAATAGLLHEYEGGGQTLPPGMRCVVMRHGAYASHSQRRGEELRATAASFSDAVLQIAEFAADGGPFQPDAAAAAAEAAFDFLRLKKPHLAYAAAAHARQQGGSGALDLIIGAVRSGKGGALLEEAELPQRVVAWAHVAYPEASTLAELHVAICTKGGVRSAQAARELAVRLFAQLADAPPSFLALVGWGARLALADGASAEELTVGECVAAHAEMVERSVEQRMLAAADLFGLDMAQPEQQRRARLADAACIFLGYSRGARAALAEQGLDALLSEFLATCRDVGTLAAAARARVVAAAYGLDMAQPRDAKRARLFALWLCYEGQSFEELAAAPPERLPRLEDVAQRFAAARAADAAARAASFAEAYGLPPRSKAARSGALAWCFAGHRFEELLEDGLPPLEQLMRDFGEQLRSSADGCVRAVAVAYGLELPAQQAEAKRAWFGLQRGQRWTLKDVLGGRALPPLADAFAAGAAAGARAATAQGKAKAETEGREYHDYAAVRAVLPDLLSHALSRATDDEVGSLVRAEPVRGQPAGSVWVAEVARLVYKYNDGVDGDAKGLASALKPASGAIATVHKNMCVMVRARVAEVAQARAGGAAGGSGAGARAGDAGPSGA